MTPVHSIYAAAGCPPISKPVEAISAKCWWCGSYTERGVRLSRALGANFSDHAHAECQTSSHLCLPCVWGMSGRPPKTFRMWSVVYREDGVGLDSNPMASGMGMPEAPGLTYSNKGDPLPTLCTLIDPPACRWACTVVDSGKLHTLPFACWNHGSIRWTIRFDRRDVSSTPDRFGDLMERVADLYRAGYTKAEIERGDPSPGRLVRCGIDRWRHHDKHLSQLRGSALLTLAIFLLRREQYDDKTYETNWHRLIGAERDRPDEVGDPAHQGDQLKHGQREGRSAQVVAASEDGAREVCPDGAQLEPYGERDGQAVPGGRAPAGERQLNLFA